jgi:hypothetical protein
MRHHVRHLCAAVTLLVLLPCEAAAQKQVTIFITKPALVRNVRAGSVDGIYDAVVSQVRLLFPCARVLTDAQRAAVLNADRDRVMSGGDDDTTSEKIADMASADYVINMEFGSNGTTNNNPERYMSTTMYDLNRSTAMARNMSSEAGWNWSPGDFVEETVAPLRAKAYEVCPWLGTVTYTRTLKENVDTSEKSTELQMGGATGGVTRSTKVTKLETENFTFTLTRARLGGVRIKTTGSANLKSESEQKLVTTNKTCFPQDAAGVVRDTGMVSGVSDSLVDRQTASGTSKAPLLSAKATVTAFEGTWMLAVEGMSSGEGQTEAVSERSGGCGTWSKIDPAGTGKGPYGRLITFMVDNLKEANGELRGKQLLSDADGERSEVSFQLTRK